jgi:hypothetical protein
VSGYLPIGGQGICRAAFERGEELHRSERSVNENLMGEALGARVMNKSCNNNDSTRLHADAGVRSLPPFRLFSCDSWIDFGDVRGIGRVRGEALPANPDTGPAPYFLSFGATGVECRHSKHKDENLSASHTLCGPHPFRSNKCLKYVRSAIFTYAGEASSGRRICRSKK